MAQTRVTKEKWEMVNEANKDLLDRYLFECDVNDLYEKTIMSYTTAIKMFYIWVLEKKNNVSVLAFQRREFQEYSKYIRDTGRSTSTHNDYMSAIRNMMEFALDDDNIEYNRNMCNKIKRLKNVRVRKKTFLTNDQIVKLYDELVARKKYKWASFLMLGYESTGRVSELLQVDKDSFLEDRNNTNYLHKKGCAENSPLLFFDNTKNIVAKYLEQRGEDEKDALWLNPRKNRNKPASGAYWCNKMSEILTEIEGKPIRFTCHDIRRSAINSYHNGTHLLCDVKVERIPYPIQDIQLLANHKSQQMTESYLPNNNQRNIESAFGIKIINQ